MTLDLHVPAGSTGHDSLTVDISAADAGWTLPYDASELAGLLRRLLEQPHEIAQAAHRAQGAREEHTWLSRARAVADDMQAVRAGELPRARTLRAGGTR